MKKLEESACGHEILAYFGTPGFNEFNAGLNSSKLGERVRNCQGFTPATPKPDNRSCRLYHNENGAMCANYVYESGCHGWKGTYVPHQLCHNDTPNAKQPSWSCQ
jgi:hypothetical protein